MYSWGNNRRINFASNYLKKQFGNRVQKVTIDAGFTCPNRDGSIGVGGCDFCNNDAFNPSYCHSGKTIKQQILEGIEFHNKRYKGAENYFAYLQAYSNTYSDLESLKKIYEAALEHEKLIGLIIGTRPDCIDREKLEYIASLAEKYYVVIEYGIESVYNSTLQSINRGHNFERSCEALELTQEYGLNAGAHFIFGFPGESRQQMMDSVEIVSKLPLHSIKFHQLQIFKGTRFEKEYIAKPSLFHQFEMEEYVEFITEYISRLNPNFIVERLAGETQPGRYLGMFWKIRYDQVLQKIEKRMEEMDLWQGKNL